MIVFLSYENTIQAYFLLIGKMDHNGWSNNKRFYEHYEHRRSSNGEQRCRENFPGSLNEINGIHFLAASGPHPTTNPTLVAQDLGSYMNASIDKINSLAQTQASINLRLSNLEKNQQALSAYAKDTRGDHLTLSNQALKNGDQISLLVSGKNVYQCDNDCTGDSKAWQGKDKTQGFYKMWQDSLNKSFSSNTPSFPDQTLSGYVHAGTDSPVAWMDGNLSGSNFNLNKPTWSQMYMLKDWAGSMSGSPVNETAPDPF